MERVKTGIQGFDDLVGGGIPRNAIVLLSGSAGAGKSVFASEFLYNGAADYKEKGLYISLEEMEKDVIEQAGQFGWDFDAQIKKGMLKMESIAVTHGNVIRIIEDIKELLSTYKPSRFVLDSISILSVYAEATASVEMLEMMGIKSQKTMLPSGDAVTRRAIMGIIDDIRRANVTTLLVSELPVKSEWLSRDTVSEFLADGVVKLDHGGEGLEGMRMLTVAKMRKTKIDSYPRPVEITPKGIVVYEREKVYK